MLRNISRSEGNCAMKFRYLIDYNVKNIFLKKSCRKSGRQTSSRPLFAFSKSFIWGKIQVVSTVVLIYFGRPRLGHAIKTNCITFRTDDLEICSVLIFYKIMKRSVTSFSTIFCVWFFKKNISHCLLAFFQEILDNMWKKFEINFLIKAFSCMTKKIRTNI